MSTLKAEICKIEKVENHPNADRLEIVQVKDWNCVVSKDTFLEGDLCLYIPIDSILPEELEKRIFGENSKVKLHKHRIRTIKLRGVISQGLVIKPEEIGICAKEGQDLTSYLGITKYEPPEELPSVYGTSKKIKKRYINSNFHKYTCIENIKNHPKVFETNEWVSITEKVHGCLQSETPISLVDGTKKSIKEIVDNKIDVPIWGMDENKNIVPTKILNWFNNGTTHEWKKIIFTKNKAGKGNYFRTIVCTTNHKFYNSISDEYIECSKLAPGDSLYFMRDDFQLSYIQEQVLIGKMLGDGSSYRLKAVSFSHKKEHEEYLDYTLISLGGIAGNKQKEVISGYGTSMVRARTIENYAIEDLFKDWFTSDKKQVPKSIIGKLSPLSLAFWYMDDGSLSHHEDQEDRANFAVCGFNEESITNLIEAFFYLGIEAVKYNADGYWRIRLNSYEAEKFFTLISPYIPNCMKYKLPERYREVPIIYLQNEKNTYRQKFIEQKIISIEDIADNLKGKMNLNKYDLETETHNFIANNIVVHNSSFRVGWVKNEANTIWKKIKKLFGLLPTHEFLTGSRNIQLSYRNKNKYFYDKNVYVKTAEMYDLKNKLRMGEVIYGEIIGNGIQHGYSYGCKEGETKFYAYDVMIDDKWLDVEKFKSFCKERGLPTVPFLYTGPYSKEIVNSYTIGASILFPTGQPIREGCVIKPLEEKINPYVGRKVLKSINPEYLLLKNNSEFH